MESIEQRNSPSVPLNTSTSNVTNEQKAISKSVSPSNNSTMGISALNHRRGYVSVGILCFINLINYMDRYTIAGVLTDVKTYYGLDNSQAGLLQTSFIVSYMIMAPIFGYLGDRYNRRYIMAGGVAFWSATTFLGSIVPSGHFKWFIFLRALVGTGEASYSTISPTIIADLFTGTSRTKMLSLFYFAVPVGSGLGYIVSGQVSYLFGHWYWALRITPGLGILSVILLLVVLVEPPRGQADGAAALKNTSILNDIVKVVKIPSFMWVTLGFTCVTFSVGALAWWVPDFMVSAIKVNGGTPDKAAVSLIFGVITCFAGIFGVVLGSLSAEWYRKFNPKADPLICFYSMLASVPLVFAACLISQSYITLSYVLMFFGITLLCMNWVLVTDITLYIVIPTRRSMAAAIQITISHTLGDACSPYVVGTISDAIGKGKNSALDEYTSMQYALFLPVFVLVVGAACFLVNSCYVEEDKENCSKVISGELESSFQDLDSVQSLNNSLNDFSSDNVHLIS